jgi:hypothetical protein
MSGKGGFFIASLAVGLFTGATESRAHHSPTPFDTGQMTEIEGIVTRFIWANPHVYIDVEVERPDGQRVVYQVEAGWPAKLVDYGWARDTLRSGDRVRVSGSPARDENDFAVLGRSLLIDGEAQPLVLNRLPGTASPFAGLADPDRNGLSAESALFGAWQPIEDFTDAMLIRPPDSLFTEAGRTASAALQAANERQSAAARCEPHSPPLSMVFQEAKSFERRGDDIVIRLAVTGDVERLIRMGNDPAETGAADGQGFSRGRWDGDALIVATSFAGLENRGISTIPARGTTLLERFELSEDRSRLEYSFELDNERYLTRPISASTTWGYRDTAPPRLECDPEIASRFLDHANP